MGRTSLAIAPGDQDVIYAVAADSSNDSLWAVYYSGDGGASWETRAPDTSLGFESLLLFTNVPYAWSCPGYGAPSYLSQGWYDNVVAVDPVDSQRVWVGGIDLFRSDDGGHNFGLASYWAADPSAPAYAHADQHAIVFHPNYNGTSNKQVFFGNDGGIFKSITPDGLVATGDDVCDESKSGVAFESLNNGYGVTQFYYGTVYPDDRQFLGGTQDNGTIYGSEAAGPNAWAELAGRRRRRGGRGPHQYRHLYAENTDGDIQKCGLGTACDPDEFATFSEPLRWNPPPSASRTSASSSSPRSSSIRSDSNFLYTGGTYLWRTQNKATSWQRASASTGSQISAIAVAPSNSSVALLGTRDGYLHRSATARASGSGTTWAKVRPRTGYVSSVTFDPYDANVAYATYSTFNDTTNGLPHVYKSTNGGATWTPADSGANRLPDIPVHSIAVDPTTNGPGSPRRLYVGTDVGVFVSIDGGANWAQENTQFPNTVTEQLLVSGASLYAFTHGRGVFRVPLTASGNQTLRLDMVQASTSTGRKRRPGRVQFKLRTPNHLNTSGTAGRRLHHHGRNRHPGRRLHARQRKLRHPQRHRGRVHGHPEPAGANLLTTAFGRAGGDVLRDLPIPSAGLVLSRMSHTVSITNDGDPVGVSIQDLTVSEGNATTTASVVVQLAYPADHTVTMNYATADGTAMAGSDYTAMTSGSLNFAVGESSKTIPIPILGDTCPDPSRAFVVNLSNVSASGILVDDQATVTLNDNDFAGTFQLSTPRLVVAESAIKAQVTVTRTGGLAGGAANCVGFSLATQAGSAELPRRLHRHRARAVLLRRRSHHPRGRRAHRQRHPGRARGVVRGVAQQPRRPGLRAGRAADPGGGHHGQRHRGGPAVLRFGADGGGGRRHGDPHGHALRRQHRPADGGRSPHAARPRTGWTSRSRRPSSPSTPTRRAPPWW